MSCRTGCPTKDHESYGACLRSGGIRVAYANSVGGWDYSKQKRWDGELANYRASIASGNEPAGTDQKSIDRANHLSDLTQAPFKA